MHFTPLARDLLLQRLVPPAPGEKLRMVLDTDTYNEVDDQFALCQAMLSPERLEVEAIYAAPFFNDRSSGPGDGMERSYEEILRLLAFMKIAPGGLVHRGSTTFLPSLEKPVESAAVRDLIARALAPNDRPLYVVAIGAITNIASALLLEPKIREKIVLVWLGGMDLAYPHTREFNLQGDPHASRTIFDCGVPVVHVPCNNIASHLITTHAELKHYLAGTTPLGDYLYNIVKNYGNGYGWSKVIWDIAATSWLIEPNWIPTEVVPSPVLTENLTWAYDRSRHPIRTATGIHRDPIFADVFRKITGSTGTAF